jgi:hypothetical protein
MIKFNEIKTHELLANLGGQDCNFVVVKKGKYHILKLVLADGSEITLATDINY